METIVVGDVLLFLLKKGMDCFASKGTDRLLEKFKKNPVDAAYDRALKRWCRNDEIREKYAVFKYSHFEDFREYLKKGPEVCSGEIQSLCKLMEEELKNDSEACRFIEEERLQIIQNEQKGLRVDLEEIKSSNIKHQEETSKQHEEQIQWLHKIFESLQNERKLEAMTVSAVTFDVDYIERKCSIFFDERNYFDKTLYPEKYPEYSLIDFVLGKLENTGNKFLLCGTAQSGKTTELKHLFHELGSSGLFRLFFREIKGWQFNLPPLSEAEQRETIVIIDALDETFDDEKRNQLFNSINNYASVHPYLKMVVSCRSNFKEISQLGCFKGLCLLDLDWEKAKQIIHLKSGSPELLINEIETKSLYGLVKSPLFIMTIIDYFKQYNSIPNHRSQLYEYLINEQLRKEDEKNLEPHSRMMTKGRKALDIMAVGLQLMDRNFFTEEELLDLLDNDSQWKRLQRSGIIENDGGKYEFTHNSFKEHLVSMLLTQLKNLEKIQSLCCYDGTKHIKPTWYNVLALYLSQLSNKDILFTEVIEWLERDNEEMLLYIEPQLINENKRCGIFIGVLEECKKKGILYGAKNRGLPETLMGFGYGSESLNYIIEEIKTIKDYNVHVSNLLRCVQFLNWGRLMVEFDFKATQLEKLVLGLFDRFGNDENAWAIWDPFDNSYFYNRKTIDHLLFVIHKSEHPKIWDSFIRAVFNAKQVNYYLDVILEKSKYVHDYEVDGVTNVVTSIWIDESLKIVDNKGGIIKVLWFLENRVKDRKRRFEFATERNSILETVIANAEKVIPQQELTMVLKQLFESSNAPVSSYGEPREFNEPIKTYLEKQGLSAQLFFEYATFVVENIDDDNNHLMSHKYSRCASYFATVERFEQFAMKHANTEIGFRAVRCLSSYIYDGNIHYSQIVKQYYPDFYIDVNQQTKLKNETDLDCLFEYSKFKTEVLKLLDENPQNRQALRKRLEEYDGGFEDKLNIYVYYYFNEFTKDREYDYERIKKSIDDENFYYHFLLKNTINLYSSGTNELSDKQKQILVQIAKDIITRFVNGDKDLTINHLYYPIEMILKGYVNDLDNCCLIKLLPYSEYYIYDNNTFEYLTLFDYIAEHPDIEKAEVMDFITSKEKSKEGVSEFMQLRWAGFILNNNIEEGFPMVFEWAKSDRFDGIIPMLIENIKTRNILTRESVIEQFPLSNRLFIYWTLVKMKEYDASWIKDKLEIVFDTIENENDKVLAMKTLLILGSEKGLQYINKHPEYYNLDGIIPNYDNEGCLSSLFEALGYLMDRKNGREGVRLYEAKTFVISSIGRIAAQSKVIFDQIEQEINSIVEKNSEKYSELNYYLSDWKENLYSKHSKQWTIEDVIQWERFNAVQ